MKTYQINRMEPWIPDVVNSYQGAFGPPTLGHYQAMLSAAKATMTAHGPNKKILMLFMPTGASSSKPHLAITRKERIDALNLFCTQLKAVIDSNKNILNTYKSNIMFVASDIEYKIYDEKKKSDTILTLEKLRELYPKAEIELTMGLDNLYDLPFWSRVSEYPTYTKKIYVAKRKTTDEDIESTIKAKDLGFKKDMGDIRFNNYASWNSKKSKDIRAALTPDLISKFESITYKFLPEPVPTSSSLLRGALRKYYTKADKTCVSKLYKLIGPLFQPDDVNNPWRQSILRIEEAIKVGSLLEADLSKKEKIFDDEYKKAFEGGRKTRRSNKRRNRQRKSRRL